jgi:FMNH2-dependent dimethyl sulfone monooxygenase
MPTTTLGDFRLGLMYPTTPSVHLLSRDAAHANPPVLDVATHVEQMRVAEAAELDYVFLADAWGGRGPVSEELQLSDPMLFCPTLAGVLIGASRHIKIITTMHQAWLHPLTIMRMGANLDALSDGRWGMNAVSGHGYAAELVESVAPTKDHDALYDAASESMEIVLQGWMNGGEVDFSGRYYQATGRMVGPHPVQRPHPVIVSAGSSPRGCEFAGRYASVVFMPGRSSAEMIADRREKIRQAAERAGRGRLEVKILIHASVLVRDTMQEADERSAELRASVEPEAVAEYLAGVMPMITTLREIYDRYSPDELAEIGLTTSTVKLHGDPESVADGIQALKDTVGCDGITLSFPVWTTDEIDAFRTKVIPLLEARGVWSSAATRGWAW